MSKTDDTIRNMGYAVKVEGGKADSYIVYENTKEDIQVEISWDKSDEDCYLHASSITRRKDWFGHLKQAPRGLDYPAVRAFMAKIDEMRGSVGKEA